MTDKKKADCIRKILLEEYKDERCSLDFENELQLLIATRLSAQCTDKRVNIVTPALFAKYKTASEFANAEISDIEEIIKSCGFYKAKAKSIKEMCIRITEEFGGKVPGNMEDLLTLSGVGRKTANLVLGEKFGDPGIVADTHCIRLSKRMGLTDSDDPLKTEKQLSLLIPKEDRLKFSHSLVAHGRKICDSRNPKCEMCIVNEYCDYKKSANSR